MLRGHVRKENARTVGENHLNDAQGNHKIFSVITLSNPNFKAKNNAIILGCWQTQELCPPSQKESFTTLRYRKTVYHC
jgi:hypothetical protein